MHKTPFISVFKLTKFYQINHIITANLLIYIVNLQIKLILPWSKFKFIDKFIPYKNILTSSYVYFINVTFDGKFFKIKYQFHCFLKGSVKILKTKHKFVFL